MLKQIVFVIFGCLFALFGFAQSNQIDQVLRNIEQNNKELKAFQALLESKKSDLKSTNNLADPKLSAFYLPFGEHSSEDYSEFQISQSFEFPTVYTSRSKWIDRKTEQLELEYDQLRQKILLKAKTNCLELIALSKLLEIKQIRVEQARKVFDQVQELFDKEQVGILDLNKAKITWMQDQFEIAQIRNEISNQLLSLQKLNGEETVDFKQSEFHDKLEVDPSDSIWQQVKANDPAIKALKGDEAIAIQQLRVQRNKLLPDLTAGFNYQGVMGNNYSGVYAGISIPLWSGKNKVKTAKAEYQYQQSNTQAIITEHHSDFLQQYNNYDLMLRKYGEYTTTLEGLNSEKLLLEAFQLGQISFMDYYGELQFYRQAYDKMLEIEKELYQLKADLLKHQL